MSGFEAEDMKLGCPRCPGEPPAERVYLEEHPTDDEVAYCLECAYTCQNFIKYPVSQVMDMKTGELYQKNMLTGERV